MAKRAIPPILVPALGLLALVAAFAIQAAKTGGWTFLPDLGPKKPVILPPEAGLDVPPPRPDADLFVAWQGKPVPEILGQLVSQSAQAPPPAAITFPDVPGVDPYRPRFEPSKAEGSETRPLPAFDDAMTIGGAVIFSADGQPLTWPALPAPTIGGRRLLTADFDGDGDNDLFIGRGAGLPSSLLRRNEKGQWEDVTTAAGLLDFLDLTDAAWVDFDRDGRLDLFTVSRAPGAGAPSLLRLYRNLDGNRFATVGRDERLTAPAPVKGFVWEDIDEDGFPDLLLSTGGEPGGLTLLVGIPAADAADWSFADATAVFGLDKIRGGGPLAIGDFDHDGHTDVVAASEGRLTMLIRGEEAAPAFAVPFADVTEALDLEGVGSPAALLFEDFDGDGFLDLAVTGGAPEAPAARAWWNRSGMRFREIPGAAGLVTSARLQRLIPLDPEGDGTRSIFLAAGPKHHGVRLDPAADLIADNARAIIALHGGKGVNPNGIGARLSILARDENWTLTNIERRVDEIAETIGLGPAEKIESVTVTWPGPGDAQTKFGKLPVNHRLELGPDPSAITKTPMPDPGATSLTATDPGPGAGS